MSEREYFGGDEEESQGVCHGDTENRKGKMAEDPRPDGLMCGEMKA
jgi:hypothetical protein